MTQGYTCVFLQGRILPLSTSQVTLLCLLQLTQTPSSHPLWSPISIQGQTSASCAAWALTYLHSNCGFSMGAHTDLFIPNVTTDNSGSYTCLIHNSATCLNRTTVKIIPVLCRWIAGTWLQNSGCCPGFSGKNMKKLISSL
jgi:hypothetical protein